MNGPAKFIAIVVTFKKNFYHSVTDCEKSIYSLTDIKCPVDRTLMVHSAWAMDSNLKSIQAELDSSRYNKNLQSYTGPGRVTKEELAEYWTPLNTTKYKSIEDFLIRAWGKHGGCIGLPNQPKQASHIYFESVIEFAKEVIPRIENIFTKNVAERRKREYTIKEVEELVREVHPFGARVKTIRDNFSRDIDWLYELEFLFDRQFKPVHYPPKSKKEEEKALNIVKF